MRFLHSGKLGDIIYALPAVRYFGPAEIYLQADSPHGFSRKDAESILPLLRSQGYITRADIFCGESDVHSFEGFREIAVGPGMVNLADCHLQLFGLPSSVRDSLWLDGVVPSDKAAGKVVFSRTGNYPGIPEFWQRCVELFAEKSVYIGHYHEYLNFRKLAPNVPYIPTENLLELASVIAGSALFIGSQSCPYAIAEGLKHPSVQETCPWVPNCLFSRCNALTVRSLADLDRLQTFGGRFL